MDEEETKEKYQFYHTCDYYYNRELDYLVHKYLNDRLASKEEIEKIADLYADFRFSEQKLVGRLPCFRVLSGYPHHIEQI